MEPDDHMYDLRVVRALRRRSLHVLAALVVFAPALTTADVQEQRTRLPPPATCRDPVEGVWMSHSFYPRVGQWYVFTLTIRRRPGPTASLEGDIHSLYWTGGPGAPEPPLCGPGVQRQAVDEPALGSITAGRIAFGGTSWRPSADFCGARESAYNPDQFSGTIDPALQEFQSLVSDGGIFTGDPTVFRRIRCLDPAPVPHVAVTPPPYYPGGHSTGGCGCRGPQQ